ncbi:hypothetical protein NDU88_000980 [Pleurodeles waltl]|uniref:Uncharacterized protein n=1 Tax=Pleurodeles waltl TaxID=8319 RepID=A0AAV7V6L7_PLEWA|nr:hypothetical protein NDU88_000980 [Pleurodeles waltl]
MRGLGGESWWSGPSAEWPGGIRETQLRGEVTKEVIGGWCGPRVNRGMRVRKMGKPDKNQAKPQFNRRKSSSPAGGGAEPGLERRPGMPSDALLGKKQLRELHLEYRMLYPAKLRVEVDGRPLFFTDHKKLAQFVKRRGADKGSCSADDTDS